MESKEQPLEILSNSLEILQKSEGNPLQILQKSIGNHNHCHCYYQCFYFRMCGCLFENASKFVFYFNESDSARKLHLRPRAPEGKCTRRSSRLLPGGPPPRQGVQNS